MTPNALITGGGGMLALALSQSFRDAGLAATSLTRAQLDVTDADAVHRVIEELRPTVVVQCAGFTRVDDAEENEARAFEVNTHAVAHVAAACKSISTLLVYPSTDYVFDGSASKPYAPDDATKPINAYGRSKLAGEHAARGAGNYLVVRTSWLYGRGGKNFVRTIATRLAAGQATRVVDDQVGSPTAVRDAADLVLRLIEREAPAGIYHATNAGFCSWFDLAREVARNLGVSPDMVMPCATSGFPTAARRPRYSVLDCSDTEPYTGPRRSWQTALTEAIRSGEY